MDDIDREELARAEAEVAALPSREPIVASPASLEGTARGRLLSIAALVLCLVTAVSETAWLGWDSPVAHVAWLALGVLLPASIVLAILAGSLAGRFGRTLGIIGGVCLVPPVSFIVAAPLTVVLG
ncbi:hypothetical protein SOM11_06540 [Frigoribacterium sp. CFBP9039]|uniref:hypothetical protein n=1 Tax=Frigoribacterium TaxID=96492 RepID=UPI00178164DE|nr:MULTISPECIES: hypothetical protein [Frigoribacterium]MBD8704542.1 hypothetical protein [Frigoribacterium sp. CFBP 13712]MCJ0702199.1 hypothetical protein [Frigoribacterium faeni]MDY0945642.1 hypothetical protein [Frigoribacterium sp. CFBP9039]